MIWKDLPGRCRAYLAFIFVLGLISTFVCFSRSADYDASWLLLAGSSFFIASVNLRLPQNPSVIVSMGDVFTLLVLLHFGAGPALLTYWANVTATTFSGYAQKHGWRFFEKMAYHRVAFNLACCAISVSSMSVAYDLITGLPFNQTVDFVLAIAGVTLVWFFANTGTLSVAVALTSSRPVSGVWRDGLGLYLLNFVGSGASAGLISIYYQKATVPVFILSLPVAAVVYYLYHFYIGKYEQAQAHIVHLNKLYMQTIETMATVVDAKDPYTHGHIRRVQAYAVKLAEYIGIDDSDQLMAIRAGALLHDIGKVAIPEYILNKPTVLTETEFEKMKIHPVVGANMLKGIEFPYAVEPLVKSHHERWDGRGYPEGLSGEGIPISARILAVVDCYDALTTNRPYRSPMLRTQLIDFFNRESGRAYDPQVVKLLIDNLDTLELEASRLNIPDTSLWDAVGEVAKENSRKLERVQPTRTYGRALRGDSLVQRELYSTFEFARAESLCLSERDVLLFMGSKLESIVPFDAAVFYIADLESGLIRAHHVIGRARHCLDSATLKLEQKLSGWVAANNQSLTNLPPFPDFLNFTEEKPDFQNSCIVPLNRNGVILGTLALYRKEKTLFSEEEFRRAEILASQTSLALERAQRTFDEVDFLVDPITGIANGFHLYLMFDQVAMDADRYEYPLALIAMRVEELASIKRKFGTPSANAILRAVSAHTATQLRDTDVLVRYSHDEFLILSPKLNRENAEALMSRLQNQLDHYEFHVRTDMKIPIPVSMGLALYPEDGSKLDIVISSSESRLKQDYNLRTAVRQNVRTYTRSL
jgi:diguanylate cyclase (GGDEF)-like protein/putative nucleotidyltransferase with HDIG domain